MTAVEKLSIDLSPELARPVRGAVERGDFETSSEVVWEALQQWERRRTRQREEEQELRRLWDDGVPSGTGHFADFMPTDGDHARADQWLRQNDRPLVTTDEALDELLTRLLVRTPGRLT